MKHSTMQVAADRVTGLNIKRIGYSYSDSASEQLSNACRSQHAVNNTPVFKILKPMMPSCVAQHPQRRFTEFRPINLEVTIS